MSQSEAPLKACGVQMPLQETPNKISHQWMGGRFPSDSIFAVRTTNQKRMGKKYRSGPLETLSSKKKTKIWGVIII
jgi:hypothetical protein